MSAPRWPAAAAELAALTIAGSDSGGGAGVQADLRTFAAHGLLGCSAITAVTAQNTQTVRRIDALPPEAVVAQIDTVLDDLPVRAAKTGMLANAAVVRAVADAWRRREETPPLVVDPVLISKGGAALLEPDAVAVAAEALLPLAAVVTPNLPEAAALLGLAGARPLSVPGDAAARLADRLGAPVLLKGGHGDDPGASVDVLAWPGGACATFEAPRVETRCDHGTGCALSAAITARLAWGDGLEDAVRAAKAWLTSALEAGRVVGGGHSPPDHLWALRPPADTR